MKLPRFAQKLLARRPSLDIRHRPALLAVARNMGWLFADKALRMVVGLFVGAWVARYLGPAQFGELSYVLSFVALFAVVTQLGLDSVAVRDMAIGDADAPAILGTVLRLRVLVGFACWGLAILVMTALRPGDTHALLLTAIAATSLVFQSADTVDLWFQSRTQSRRTVVSKMVASLGTSVLKVGLIVAGAPLATFVATSVVELALTALLLWRAHHRYPAPTSWRWSGQHARSMLREAWPYLLAGMATIVYMRIDQLMLRELVDAHELGLYSAALAVSSGLYVIPTALCLSVAPAMARLHLRDPAAYERALGKLFAAAWWTTIPIVVVTVLLAPTIVSVLFGPRYTGSAPMLAVHVLATIPVALGVAQSDWIVNERRNQIALWRTALGAVCNVVLNLLLIPRYGGVGAAAATVAAQCVAAILSNAVLAPRMLRLQMYSLLNLRLHPPVL